MTKQINNLKENQYYKERQGDEVLKHTRTQSNSQANGGVRMDKKSRTNKIIQTVVWSIAILIVLSSSAKYFFALFTMDDELMFIYGFNLMVVTCTIVLILIFSVFISSAWDTKGKDNEKSGE